MTSLNMANEYSANLQSLISYSEQAPKYEKRTSDGFLLEAFRQVKNGSIKFAGRIFTHDIFSNHEGKFIKVKWESAINMIAVAPEFNVKLKEISN
jgi:hypothetical protein